MTIGIADFVAKWSASGAAERANKDHFVVELCDVLGVPRPNPTTGDRARDTYVFERDALFAHEGGVVTVGKIDVYKEGCFILEAKQGSEEGSAKRGTAKRGTPAWNIEMRDAYGQALGYARSFAKPVPILIVCDIGHCFDLYAAFDGSWAYRPFPNPQASRIFLKDLEKHTDTLRAAFTDPGSLDPAKHAADVTRTVASHLADLARKLERDGHASETVATFLMRCIFTMFAEDVGLLPEDMFKKAIEQHWIPSPASFPGGVETLWRTMNEGGHTFTAGKLLRFNGGLFAAPSALPLDRRGLEMLLEASACNWSNVEPAIFGTLLERALNPQERHLLGAHFTPRAYVERLVRPTIEEPLRQDWEIVQAQVRQLVLSAADDGDDDEAMTEAEYLALGRAGEKKKRKSKGGQEGARTKKLNQARALLHEFHRKLASTRVLDPACGSGNFLYVTLDLFKRLEAEVLAALDDLGDKQELLRADAIRVTPAQFLGVEVKRWAKEIAELVLWIGYLQWHFRTYGKNVPVPEPVLHDYKNIECRDAILAWDSVELLRDETTGKPITRWDGVSMKKSPVTGEDVPNEDATNPVYRYVNPRKAEWPEAEFIVGNPPFLGTRRMRLALGDGYVDALIAAAPDVPENADYVMHWWDRAATLARGGSIRAFGLITTNSIVQTFNRAVTQRHLVAKPPLSIRYAIPDHPWVESTDGAAVRVAMTVGIAGEHAGRVVAVAEEIVNEDSVDVTFTAPRLGVVGQDLRVGASPAGSRPLHANSGIAYWGAKFYGDGFIVTPEEAARQAASQAGNGVGRPFLSARDFTGVPRGLWVLDCDGLDEAQLRNRFPATYQHLLERVKPVRAQNPRAFKRERWWVLGENQPGMRRAVASLERYVMTPETAKHRVFSFLPRRVLAEGGVAVIALDDAFFLGTLSSRLHVVWALAAGGRLGVGNDPRYNKTRCFDPFPFPACDEATAERIRTLAESLDSHRKRQQSLHPDLTITGMYNVFEKLRAGAELSAKEKVIHEHGLVSVLKKLHDDLDAAVFDAYGWPHDLTDEQILERLVALNAERAAEERRGVVRWLRPDFQNPSGKKEMTQTKIDASSDEDEPEEAAPAAATPWPKKLPEQLALVRDLLVRSPTAYAAEHVAAAFKGAKAKDAESILEALAALGVLVAYDSGDGRRWKSASQAS